MRKIFIFVIKQSKLKNDMIEFNKEMKNAVSEHFSYLQRGEPGFCNTHYKIKDNHIQVWTSLTKNGEAKYKGVHYEYWQGDGYVQLHFENWGGINEDFQSHKYRYFRDTLREETSDTSKYPELKWDKWQGKENCRCIYKKEMNSKKVSDNGFADIDLEM